MKNEEAIRIIAGKLQIPLEFLESAQLDFTQKTLKKGESIARIGEKCLEISYVQSGVLYKSLCTSDGKEVTTDIISSGGFASPYSDQIMDRASSLNIKTLTKSTLICVSFNEIRLLSLNHPSWMRVILGITEGLYVEKIERERFFLALSAKEKIDYFFKMNKDLIGIIPKNIIASYLGINPSTFSRLYQKD